MVPHKCPICNGCALVKASFYKLKEKGHVQCKSCINGIIWDFNIQPLTPYQPFTVPYQPFTPPYDIQCGGTNITDHTDQKGLTITNVQLSCVA